MTVWMPTLTSCGRIEDIHIRTYHFTISGRYHIVAGVARDFIHSTVDHWCAIGTQNTVWYRRSVARDLWKFWITIWNKTKPSPTKANQQYSISTLYYLGKLVLFWSNILHSLQLTIYRSQFLLRPGCIRCCRRTSLWFPPLLLLKSSHRNVEFPAPGTLVGNYIS